MEIWKDIKDYEGMYQVSNIGRVRSLDRYVVKNDGVVQFRKGKIISANPNDDGYLRLKLCKNGKDKTVAVHLLVAQAFIPLPDNNKTYEVNHIDCNRKNNNVSNLEWVTHAENIEYSIIKGNHVSTKNLCGTNNPNYGNHKLRDYYKNNPIKAVENLSRPGKQNGRATPIRMYDSNKNLICEFDWIGECAQYLIDNNYTQSKSISGLRDRISSSIRNNTTYLNCYFERA